MKTIRVRHKGLTAADVQSWLGIPAISVTPPDPPQIQDISLDDAVDLPLVWPSIREIPPGYVWMGEIINGEFVETPEPQIT